MFVIGRDQRHAKKKKKGGLFWISFFEQYLKGIMYMHAFSIFANNEISSTKNMTQRTVCVVFQKDEMVDVKLESMSKLNSLAQEKFPGLLLFLYMRHDGNDVQQQQVSSHHNSVVFLAASSAPSLEELFIQ